MDVGSSFACKFCSKEGCIAAPRITFKFDATDGTGDMTFTAFTQECEILFRMDASEIYDEIAAGIFEFEPIAHRLSTRPFLLQIAPGTALARNKILTWVPKAVRWN
ncbi:uncharacterized protein LOC125499583 [Beta vulgaris subsp. vulgaris]|uniref:uncharacterized protein LOC125497420 n=1 Tax=Beta vulgaris subsp. vulgaris TaxID=3555 RepID=UPI00254739AB|nr:uncharacterized protein LOC125497420 [Beta vulgaris subsp. vulgaris]XP_048504505.2 uncharacterized protein LOC125499583 [Beta vulgaris subsp. vulgaris]